MVGSTSSRCSVAMTIFIFSSLVIAAPAPLAHDDARLQAENLGWVGAREVHFGLPLHASTVREVTTAFDSGREPGTRATPEEAEAMREVIRRHFEGVQEETDIVDPEGELNPSWDLCSTIDYTASTCLQDTGSYACASSGAHIKHTAKVLGVSACLFGANGTVTSQDRDRSCPMVHAFLASMDELTKTFSSGPSFANHAVVGWNSGNTESLARKGGGPFPSWRRGGVEAAFATEDSPPSATWKDLGAPYGRGNAATAWAICDIARTVLQQNTNQARRGTCVFNGFLSALSMAAPVHTLKLALELFWTGTLEALPAPCDYAYNQLPGLVPIPEPNPTKCANPQSTDCEVAMAAALPIQAVGLSWTWAVALKQALYLGRNLPWEVDDEGRFVQKSCKDVESNSLEDPQRLTKVTGPWRTDEEIALIGANDGSLYYEEYFCKTLFNDAPGACHFAGSAVFSQGIGHRAFVTGEEAEARGEVPEGAGADIPYLFEEADPPTSDTVTPSEMDRACRAVEAGGVAVFGVASRLLSSSVIKGGVGMMKASKAAGALSKCEVPPLASWDTGVSLYEMLEANWINSTEETTGKTKAHVLELLFNSTGTAEASEWTFEQRLEVLDSVVEENGFTTGDHAIALRQCYDDPSHGMTYVFATYGLRVRMTKGVALALGMAEDRFGKKGILNGYVSATSLKGMAPVAPAWTTCETIDVKQAPSSSAMVDACPADKAVDTDRDTIEFCSRCAKYMGNDLCSATTFALLEEPSACYSCRPCQKSAIICSGKGFFHGEEETGEESKDDYSKWATRNDVDKGDVDRPRPVIDTLKGLWASVKSGAKRWLGKLKEKARYFGKHGRTR